MSIKINQNYVQSFIKKESVDALYPLAKNALKTTIDKSGAGNDFLGWVDLPVNYDKEEFARIKIAAKKNPKVL